ncbi:SAM-dependent chlorinase/fluorinase [Candidatus Micrarchaeota archaeon]|nr:SAM-dependent chlorinase/fluorinase [Candidatus Micrarchaeota archaeon]
MESQRRTIRLLTDFGPKNGPDYAVGRLKAVAASISHQFGTPLVDVVDLDHTVPAQKTLAGAWRLMISIPDIPPGDVIVAIVDPHVGSDRAAAVIELNTGHTLVGPIDMGLLSAAAQLYGIKRARFIKNEKYFHKQELLFQTREVVTGEFFGSVAYQIGNPHYQTFHGLSRNN